MRLSLKQALFSTILGAVTATQSKAHGELSILTLNDLTQTLVPHTGAILLGTPRGSQDQEEVCEQIGETLWSPEVGDFKYSLEASLEYLQWTGQYSSSQKFHVAGTGAHSQACRYMDAQGKINNVRCEKNLPALCTNSAPLSNITSTDRNPKYYVVQRVGNQELVGIRDQHTFKFQGVKYAEFPGRYEYSTPKNMMEEVGSPVNATNYGSHCWQPPPEVTDNMSEDCLFLNIWTSYLPSKCAQRKPGLRAVMMNIHGGGFVTGTGANPNYDGTQLASRGNVVIVNVNYRLGNFANIPFTDSIHNGNYGLGDLVTALQWIRANIHYFGGDPNNVTIFGESAGALAVRALISSEKAKGLFKNAIEQSPPMGWDMPMIWDWITYREPSIVAEHLTTRLAQDNGCPAETGTEALECLKQIEPQALLDSQPPEAHARFQVKDGEILKVETLELTWEGTASDVNLITGTNRNEAAILMSYPTKDTNLTEWMTVMLGGAIMGVDTAPYHDALPLFLPENPSDPDITFNGTENFLNLGLFTCKNHAISRTAVQNGAVKNLWMFEFTRSYSSKYYTTPWCSAPVDENFPNGNPSLEYYKCHGGELLYVCGNIVRSGEVPRDENDIPLAQVAVDYWTSFARTGDPNPEEGYMNARRYQDSLDMMKEAGRWGQLTAEEPDRIRLMQALPHDTMWSESERCRKMGIPVDEEGSVGS